MNGWTLAVDAGDVIAVNFWVTDELPGTTIKTAFEKKLYPVGIDLFEVVEKEWGDQWLRPRLPNVVDGEDNWLKCSVSGHANCVDDGIRTHQRECRDVGVC